MTIDSKNVLKAISVFAAIFWLMERSLRWFREPINQGKYEKAGLLDFL